jgi:hypothetical protein
VDLTVTAWAEDCVVTGRIALDGDERLIDALNAQGRLEVGAVSVEALEDGRIIPLDHLSLGLDELCAVELAGPRGHPERRRGTVRHRIAVEIGPYVITGSLHALPGVSPLATFRHRPPVVALTDAVIELSGPKGDRRWSVPVAGISQHRVETLREVPTDPDAPEASEPSEGM